MMRCLLLVCVVFAGCGWSDDEAEDKPAPLRMVGRIASVHEADGFVLVQSFDDRRLRAGLVLTTQGDEERSASLVVTGERAGRYSAADVRGGTVEVGDAVFERPVVEEETEEEVFDEKVSVPEP